MPDPVVTHLGIVADLTFEVGGGGRRTRAHLSGGPGTLVLDVDDPGVLLRSLPRRSDWYRQWSSGITDPLSGTTMQVRSGGRALGSVRFERGRRAALRPTGAGITLALRRVAARRPVRMVAAVSAAVLLAVRIVRARRG